MSHIVDFFNTHFGAGGGIAGFIIFAGMAVLGTIIAFRGRQAMIWLVSFCALFVGVLGGAMIGLLVFDSFIIMLAAAFIGGAALLLLVKYVKGIGYFIGIGTLGFFLAYIVTSEMYMTNTRITENTLLVLDLVIGAVTGVLSVINSKYIVSAVTAAAGGMICSVSVLAMFGCYFSDWKMWLIALAVSAAGMIVQIRIYDLKPPVKKKKKPERNKHVKRK